MLLSARILSQISSVNSFEYADNAQWNAGDTVTLTIQLVDMTQNPASQGFYPAGIRYMAATGATLSVTLTNIDSAVQIQRYATQPYAQDPSIWQISILPSDAIRGTCDLVINLNESGKVTAGRVKAAVLIGGF